MRALLDRVAPVLGDDTDAVVPVLLDTVASGGGAGRQRAAAGPLGDLRAAAALVVAEDGRRCSVAGYASGREHGRLAGRR